MTRRAGETLLVLLTTSTLSLTGCFTIAKQAIHEARGAQGELLPVSTVGDSALARCRSIVFTPADTTAGPRLCPPALLREYDAATRKLAARLRPHYPGGAPTLTVDSEILYFQRKGLLSGAFMLTRVRMRADDRLAVDAIIKAESAAYTAGGEDDLADATVDALGRFLRRNRPAESSAGRRD